MATQQDIDNLTQQVTDSTAAIMQKIEEETQEVKDFIAAHPEIDTSALESAVAGLESIAQDVDNILPDAPPAGGGDTGTGEPPAGGGDTGTGSTEEPV